MIRKTVIVNNTTWELTERGTATCTRVGETVVADPKPLYLTSIENPCKIEDKTTNYIVALNLQQLLADVVVAAIELDYPVKLTIDNRNYNLLEGAPLHGHRTGKLLKITMLEGLVMEITAPKIKEGKRDHVSMDDIIAIETPHKAFKEFRDVIKRNEEERYAENHPEV